MLTNTACAEELGADSASAIEREAQEAVSPTTSPALTEETSVADSLLLENAPANTELPGEDVAASETRPASEVLPARDGVAASAGRTGFFAAAESPSKEGGVDIGGDIALYGGDSGGGPGGYQVRFIFIGPMLKYHAQ